MIEAEEEESWEAPFSDAFDEDTQSFPFGTNSLYANPDCKARKEGRHPHCQSRS